MSKVKTWHPLARVFEAWGFDRYLWGTDWTRAFAVVNYDRPSSPSVSPTAWARVSAHC